MRTIFVNGVWPSFKWHINCHIWLHLKIDNLKIDNLVSAFHCIRHFSKKFDIFRKIVSTRRDIFSRWRLHLFYPKFHEESESGKKNTGFLSQESGISWFLNRKNALFYAILFDLRRHWSRYGLYAHFSWMGSIEVQNGI